MRLYFREKVIAAACCALGMAACYMMWHEAGFHKPNRRLHLFGDRRSTPFWEKKYPEGSIFMCGLCYGLILLGMFGLLPQRPGTAPGPEVLHGPAFVGIGIFFGLLLIQARTKTGVSLDVFQSGFYLALAVNGGLIAAGVAILVRAGWGDRRGTT
jgi:hypothetical protein